MSKKEDAALRPNFRDWVKKGSTKFPLVKGRYHLYMSLACPLCQGILIIRNLLGLEESIGVSITHPLPQKTRENEDHYGWTFGQGPYQDKAGRSHYYEDTIPDPYLNSKFLRDVYDNVKNSSKAVNSFSIPVLYDNKENIIVNNSSSDLYDMVHDNFRELATNQNIDLNPPELKQQRTELEAKLFENIIKRVYECGFSIDQDDYNKHVNALYEQLNEFEDILGNQRYLLSDQMTIPDIRLFTSLLRFDEVYAYLFRTNKKLIQQYPNLLNFSRDLYQYGNIKQSVNMQHIKVNYFNMDLNPSRVIPIGSNFEELLQQPHNRA